MTGPSLLSWGDFDIRLNYRCESGHSEAITNGLCRMRLAGLVIHNMYLSPRG